MHNVIPVILSFVLGIVLSVTTGCSMIDRVANEPTNIRYPVMFGTLELIKRTGTPPERVLSNIDLIKDHIEGNPIVSLKEFKEDVIKVLNVRDMNPILQIALNDFLNLLLEIIQEEVEKGVNAKAIVEQQVLVRTVLDWVEQAATIALNNR